MKKMILGLSVGATLICSSCEEWLTIQPETTIAAETLFSTDEGIIGGLNGAYYRAMSIYYPTGCWGGAGFLENMANTYYYDPLLGYDGYYFSIHVYDQSDTQENVNESCFMQTYNVIANLNSLLNEMVKNVDILTPETYKIVRGEAYALRACCHLDLIRLYGPVPSEADAGITWLPYVRENDIDRYSYHTFDQFMDYVQQDLDSAEMFLEEVEPVLNQTFASTETTGVTWPYRKSRCNYYAVLALQARAALWRGDDEKALRYAQMVKNATNADGTPKIQLTTPSMNVTDYMITDNTHYSEHIFGIKNEDYDVMSTGNAFSSVARVVSTLEFVPELYGENYTNDLRYMHFWGSDGHWDWVEEIPGDIWSGHSVWVSEAFYIDKYSDFRSSLDSPHNYPVIRLPEMYFVIMECGTLAEANEVYEEYCEARNIEYVPLTEEDRQERVILESIREYVAEGQNFFTYKRNNVQNMYGATTTCSPEQYIFPLPDAEVSDVL